MDKFGDTVSGIIASVVTLAIIALVISQHATSVGVLTSFFQGLTGLLGVAISPVTGTTSQFANTGLTSSGLFQSTAGGISTGVNSGGVNLNLGGLGSAIGSFGNAGGVPAVAGDLSNYGTSASDYSFAPGFSFGG